MNKWKLKIISVLLVFAMVFTIMPTSIFAVNIQTLDSQTTCTHKHDENCGYREASAGSSCTHTGEKACGTAIEKQDEIPCDKECASVNEDGSIEHGSDCAYLPGVAEKEAELCDHTDDCGFTPAMEGSDCNHICDAECGPQKAEDSCICDPVIGGDNTHTNEECPFFVAIEKESSINVDAVLSGFCGAVGNEENVTWALTQNNEDAGSPTYTLAIKGSGAMADYTGWNKAPWCTAISGEITDKNLINKLEIEDGITEIGAYAFVGHVNIPEIILPNSIEEVHRDAFNNCKAVTKIEWSSELKIIGRCAFQYLEGYTGQLELPDGLQEIGFGAFGEGKYSGDLRIPDRVTIVGEVAFANNTKLTGTLTLGEKLETIGNSAFGGCNFTGNLTIPNSVITIGDSAFPKTFTGKLILGNKLETIGNNAFVGAGFTEILTIPNSVKSIGLNSFSANKFSVIRIGSPSISIGNSAFLNCTSTHSLDLSTVLNEATFGSSVFNSLANPNIIYLNNPDMVSVISDVITANRSSFAITNGGTFPESRIFEAGKLASPTKDGYIFEGWYDNAEFTGEKVVEPQTNKTYFANWIINIPFNVSNEEELKEAVANASNNADSPTIINVSEDIELTEAFVIPEGKAIKLCGGNDSSKDYTNYKKITAASEYDAGISINFITVNKNSSLITENIILDADYKGRVVAILESGEFTMNKGTWITKGGNPQSIEKLSGGGIYTWSENASITINGGKISDCQSSGDGNGGAVTVGDPTATLTMNGGIIENNSGSYAGGVFIAKGTAYLSGGIITNNTGTDVQHTYGGGVFVSKDSFVYLGGTIEIIGNQNSANEQSDLWLGVDNTSVLYLQKEFTGKVGLCFQTRNDGDTAVEAASEYVITSKDFSNFFSNTVSKGLYLSDGKIKVGKTYKITFNSNIGNESETSTQMAVQNVATSLTPNTFIRKGYGFKGWNTLENGEGTAYANSGDIALGVDTVLYAQWGEPTITLVDKVGENALTYDGTAKSLKALLENDEDAVFTYSYAKKNADGTYTNPIEDAPTEVGYYKVISVLTDDNRTATAYLEIKPANIAAATKFVTVMQGDTRTQRVDLSTIDLDPLLSTIGAVDYTFKKTQDTNSILDGTVTIVDGKLQFKLKEVVDNQHTASIEVTIKPKSGNYKPVTATIVISITEYVSPGSGGASSPSNKTTEPVIGSTKINATVSKKGNVTATITEKNITDAMANAKNQADEKGINAGEITAVIYVTTGGKSINNITVNLPKTTQKQIIDSKLAKIKLVIGNPDITIGLDLATMTSINKQANADAAITANKIKSSTLSKKAKAAIGTRPVYDLKATYKNGSKKITSFGEGMVSVEIPYKLKKGEVAGGLYAVYVDAKGKVNYLTDSSYDIKRNVLMFSTNHFSVYGIGYKKPTSFTDIKKHWAKTDIEFVVNRGLLKGTSNTTFSPDRGITRGMFVTALGKLAKVNVSSYKQSSFSDIKQDAYYMGYVEWAVKNKIVKGISDGKFDPDGFVTREEMAVIMKEYANVIGYQLPVVHAANTFEDNAKIDSQAAASVKSVQMAGIITGKTGNLFDPKGTATKAQVSAMLKRFIELTIFNDTAQGWMMNDSGKLMYYENGKALTGTKNINGTNYTFNSYGEIVDA